MDPYTRICGIWAVEASGNKDQKRRLASAVLTNISDWENRVLGEAVEPTLRYSADLLERTMQEIVSFNRSPLQQEILLIGLVGLLEREPHIEYR